MSAISDIQHNQQTELSMLRCRLASHWSEIVKNMSYSDYISYCQAKVQVPGQVQVRSQVRSKRSIDFLGQILSPNQYCMTSKQCTLISAFKMTFRMIFRMTFKMTFRMTFRMTFKTWDFRRVFKRDFEGDLEGDLRKDLERNL